MAKAKSKTKRKARPKAKHKAYPYSRISTGTQKKGGGLRRQASSPAIQNAKNEGFIIDRSWKLIDDGKSAYHGDNLAIGKLSVFIQAVKTGEIEEGSALIVEHLDRLTRQNVRTAAKLFLDILEYGISIVTNDRTFWHDSNEMMDVIIAVVILGSVHDESLKKAKRHKDNWQQWADDVLAGRPSKHNFYGRCPSWLIWNGKKIGKMYSVNREVAKTIKRILKLYQKGKGTTFIANTLNDEQVPTLGHGKRWSSGQIKHLLSNKELTGWRQLEHDAKPYGEPVKLYPEVIDTDTYYTVQGMLKRRSKNTGRRGSNCTNLFSNLVSSYSEVENSWVNWRIHSANGHTTLAGPREKLIKRGDKTIRKMHIPYGAFEHAILNHIKELDIKSLFSTKKSDNSKLRAKITGLKAEIEKIKARIKKKYSEALADVLYDQETELKVAQQLLEESEVEVRNSSMENIKDLQKQITSGNDRDRIKAHIKHLVSSIKIALFREQSEQNRWFAIRIDFQDLDYARMMFMEIKRNGSNKGVDVVVVSGKWINEELGFDLIDHHASVLAN